MIDNQDILEFLRLFNQHKVRYILVGGYAVIHYTEPRFTKDIDFCVEATGDNANKIITALSAFGIPQEQLNHTLFSTEGNFFKFGRPPWRIDLITSLKGVSFPELYKNAQEISIGGHKVLLVSKSDLIRIKRAAGRPQDLLDIEKLER